MKRTLFVTKGMVLVLEHVVAVGEVEPDAAGGGGYGFSVYTTGGHEFFCRPLRPFDDTEGVSKGFRKLLLKALTSVGTPPS